MTRRRILIYIFGGWVGGLFIAFLCFALLAGTWSYVALWTVLAATLAAALFRTLYVDPRAASRDGPR